VAPRAIWILLSLLLPTHPLAERAAANMLARIGAPEMGEWDGISTSSVHVGHHEYRAIAFRWRGVEVVNITSNRAYTIINKGMT
jgi:hypothetical protein